MSDTKYIAALAAKSQDESGEPRIHTDPDCGALDSAKEVREATPEECERWRLCSVCGQERQLDTVLRHADPDEVLGDD